MWYEFCRDAFSMGRFHSYTGGLTLFIGILLVAVIVYLLVKNSKSKVGFDNSESILKERLAKGDINEEEYTNLLKKLKK